MNREIKFRGKRVDNGEWVHGYYTVVHGTYYITQEREGKTYLYHSVFPETVGQYTGLKDKNGKEIYEGDIVNAIANREFERHSKISDVLFNSSDGMQYQIRVNQDMHHGLPIDWSGWISLEIIGNIHDNPELINQTYKNK